VQLKLDRVCELRLQAPVQPGRALHLSAASGLVKRASHLYVVADDELHLGVFPADGAGPGTLLRMFAGELPQAPKARKQHKPDLEALVALPPFGELSHGALLALGSGSTQQRCRAVLLPLQGDAVISSQARVLDLSHWFASLSACRELDCTRLNIEGAALWLDRFVLMHRGNQRQPANYLISFGLREVLEAIARDDALSEIPILDIQRYDLGSLAEVPLCFTDGVGLHDGRLVFAAVAEDTTDSYLDGPCRGAAIGVIGRDGRLDALYPLAQNHKVEGVHVELQGSQLQLWLVTDADDPLIAAQLLRGVLPS
jgi:hypothetical protein